MGVYTAKFYGVTPNCPGVRFQEQFSLFPFSSFSFLKPLIGSNTQIQENANSGRCLLE